MLLFVKTCIHSLQSFFPKVLFSLISIGFASIILSSCGGGEKPASGEYTVMKNITVGATVDQALADKGKAVFQTKCTACHKYDTRLVGPPLKEVTKRRSAEYIISMIMHPEDMQDNNDTVKALVKTYMTKMTNQNVNEADAKAIYEHLRAIADEK
jgi:mono/diheme cytochrome c family protein